MALKEPAKMQLMGVCKNTRIRPRLVATFNIINWEHKENLKRLSCRTLFFTQFCDKNMR